MSIKFGWTGDNRKVVPANEDPFKGALVLIVKALEGKRRQFEFSDAAIEKMGLWYRTNGLEGQPEFTGLTISRALDDETGDQFLFVNDGKYDTVAINIHKTNCGFSDKLTYDFLANKFSLDVTKDNYIQLEEVPVNTENISGNLYKISGVYTPQNEVVTSQAVTV